MIKAILKGLLNMITKLVNLFLLPINLIFSNLFSDMSQAIATFNQFVTQFVGGTFSYFFSILPPIFRNVLVIWVTFLITYYTIHFTYMTAIKVWNIIQKIKFW